MKNKSLCVALETTTSHLGISILESTKSKPRLLGGFFKKTGSRQSELLIPKLKKVLTKIRVGVKDISVVAVDIGPGSFTGVRVGVSAARALAQFLRVPLIGVSSLEAMAWAVGNKNPRSVFVPCIPALQGELYFSVFKRGRRGLREAQKPTWQKTSELKQVLQSFSDPKEVCVAVESWRPDFLELKSVLPKIHWEARPVVPQPFVIGEIAMSRWANSKKDWFYSHVQPLYLQPSWAERGLCATPAK